MKIRPWTMILTMLAGWINQHQQDVIEYLKTENAILKEKIGKKRIILSDEQRRKLAVLAKRIGRNGLSEICGIFSPETLMRWHRMLIARKYDGSVRSVKLFCMIVRLISDLTCCSTSSSLPEHAAGVIWRCESFGDNVARKTGCEIGVTCKH